MLVFPELYTERLHLRQLQAADIPSLVKHANNKKIADQVKNIPHPYNEPDAVFRISYVLQGFKTKARYVFSIIEREREELIGEVGLHMDGNGDVAQLGYWIAEPFWGQGIATEAVKVVLKFGFERLKLERIFATCHEENVASIKVIQHNGMVNSSLNGGVIQYWQTKTAYETQQSKQSV